MRVLRHAAELILTKSVGRKSKDQRMPSGDTTIPAAFPSRFNPATTLPGQPERQIGRKWKKKRVVYREKRAIRPVLGSLLSALKEPIR